MLLFILHQSGDLKSQMEILLKMSALVKMSFVALVKLREQTGG